MKFTLSIFLSFIFLACNSSHKTPLVVYSPHGKDMLEEFEKRFEKVHPDVDVQWLDMGSQDAYDRIRTEKENPQADVWWGAPSTMFIRAEKESLLAAYTPTWAEHIAQENKSAHNFWYGTFATPEVIAFNSHLLTAEEAPKDWNDLLEPKWKGKIILRYPLASGTLRIIFSSIIAQSVKNYGTDENGFQWLRRLDANTKAYTPDPTQMYLRLAREEAEVTLWDMPDIVFQSEVNHYPFGYNFPKSGTVSLTDGIAIVRGCKHEKLAEEFYEFVTSKESMILQAKKFYRIPARNDIPRDSLPKWITSTHFTTMPIDWNLISQHESEWMEEWDSEIKGKGSQ